MQWRERVKILCDIYCIRCWDAGPEALNEVEMTLFCVPPFQAEMINGSFWAFFYNSTGAFVTETQAALRRVGAPTSASLLSQATRVCFCDHPVPREASERRRLLEQINGDRTAEVDHLDDKFWEADEPLDDLLLAYAQANEAQLRLTSDEAATAMPLDGDWRQCTECWDAWEQPRGDMLAFCPACQALTLLRETRSPGIV